MNDEELEKRLLNIEIENILYPLVTLLKENNGTSIDIVREIEKFKGKHTKVLAILKRSYVEQKINEIYSKRNNGKELLHIKEQKEEER